MSYLKGQRPNYDKHPFVAVAETGENCLQGWDQIAAEISGAITVSGKTNTVIVVECYPGVNESELAEGLRKNLQITRVILSAEAMKDSAETDRMVQPDVTGDEVFGYISRLNMDAFFDPEKLEAIRGDISRNINGTVLVCGPGASSLADADIFIYADMPRWEGQLRFRRNEASNLGVQNAGLKWSQQYKRAYFVDWRVCDRHKKKTAAKWDYVLDTVIPGQPKMISAKAFFTGIKQVVRQPFRVVPFFDPGPWGGQWMKEVCDLDFSAPNYAWCFDCVPEENSLLLRFGQTDFETPAINLVFFEPKKLLGEPVYARFGDEFPIRFDFLDTMQGGNLSLQVHPLTAYIREQFGMAYTQDESYYLLDAGDDACVYLGLCENVQPEVMVEELRTSKQTGVFDAEKHVQKWPVKKHDHVLIPAGTVHCSGRNAMVLEISATPYIFTFKLWDWGRLGLDGLPRPINIEHGKNVINWQCTADKVPGELLHAVTDVESGDGWKEERTGLHATEFIETRRHWFSKTVPHHTRGLVHVLNLVEGREAVVESPAGRFAPFVVHFAETFIIPAAVGEYTVSPYGESEGQTCATIKAYVRTNA